MFGMQQNHNSVPLFAWQHQHPLTGDHPVPQVISSMATQFAPGMTPQRNVTRVSALSNVFQALRGLLHARSLPKRVHLMLGCAVLATGLSSVQAAPHALQSEPFPSSMMLTLINSTAAKATAIEPPPNFAEQTVLIKPNLPQPHFLTEAELSEKSADIAQFWQTHVTQGQFAAHDQRALHFAYTLPANAKAVIVLVNGRTESVLKYQELFYELTNAGYAVFSYDHRGQGLSSRLLDNSHKGHVENFQDYVADLFVFVDQVVKTKTDLPRFVMAHSMGGAITSFALAQRSNDFVAAALMSPMHAPNAELVFGARDGCRLETMLGWSCSDCFAGFTDQPFKDRGFDGNVYTHSQLRYQRFMQVYQQHPQIQLGGPTWQWLAQACAVEDAVIAQAPQIKTPMLVLQASADQAVTAEAQQAFCQASQFCAHQQVLTIKDARHELMIEADQYRIPALQAVFTFFAEQSKPLNQE